MREISRFPFGLVLGLVLGYSSAGALSPLHPASAGSGDGVPLAGMRITGPASDAARRLLYSGSMQSGDVIDLDEKPSVPCPTGTPKDPAFLMPIDQVFTIQGRGTVVTGRVERGVVEVGHVLEIIGLRDTQKTVATGVEQFREVPGLSRGMAGDNIGVLLRGIGRDDVERGQVLAAPGSIKSHMKISATLMLLPTESGGRHVPFFSGYRPNIGIWTAEVPATILLPKEVESLAPGQSSTVTAKLSKPVAMELGQNFRIVEGGRTVGVGKITGIDD